MPKDRPSLGEVILSWMTRWMRGIYAWETVRTKGVFDYQVNAVSGARRARRNNRYGHSPLDIHWVSTGVFSEDGPRPPPPAPLRRLPEHVSLYPQCNVHVPDRQGADHTDLSFALRTENEVLKAELERAVDVEKELKLALEVGEKWRVALTEAKAERDDLKKQLKIDLDATSEIAKERDELRDEAAEWKRLALRESGEGCGLNQDLSVALAERDLARQLLDGIADVIRIHQEKRA